MVKESTPTVVWGRLQSVKALLLIKCKVMQAVCINNLQSDHVCCSHLLMNAQHLVLQIGKGKVVKVTGIHSKSRTATCLLRGSNKLVLEEAERSLHVALCVVRCLVHKKFLIAGGAAPEIELVTQLSKWAKTLQVGSAYSCARLVLRAHVLKTLLSLLSGPHAFTCVCCAMVALVVKHDGC